MRPSVCPVVTHQEAACDAASVHYGLTVRRTERVVSVVIVSDV